MEKINTMIYPRSIKQLSTGQILFEEHSETFYEVVGIYEKFAHLVPFHSRDYKNLVRNLDMYVADMYLSNYALIPRT